MTTEIDISRFRSNQTPIETATPQPGMFSWVTGGLRRAAGAALSPLVATGGVAMEGLADQLAAIFHANRPEITQQTRAVFRDAFIRRPPENMVQLRDGIRAFLQERTQENLDTILSLAALLTQENLRALDQEINDEGILLLTQTLRTTLGDADHVAENPSEAGQYTLTPEATEQLSQAQALLDNGIQNTSGTLLHVLEFLNQTISDPRGPLQNLRRQLINPETGMIAEALQSVRTQLFDNNAGLVPQLRRDLLSRVPAALRTSKEALDAYLAALERGAPSTQLIPLMTAAHGHLTTLFTHWADVPEITEEHRNALEGLHAQLAIHSIAEPFPDTALLLTQLRPQLEQLTLYFTARRGIVEESVDLINSALPRILSHIETMPGRIIGNLFSPASAATDPAPPLETAETEPTDPATGGGMGMDAILARGGSMLSRLLSLGSNAFTSRVASSMGTFFQLTLEQVRDHIANQAANGPLIAQINPLIDRLRQAAANSSWGELVSSVQATLSFLRAQQVYFQGFRLPLNPARAHFSAIPDFLRNINAHQEAIQSPLQRQPTTVTDEMMQRQRDILKVRSAAYGPVSILAEKFLGMTTGAAFYAEIFSVQASQSPGDLPDLFRKRFFEKIDQCGRGVFFRWAAKSIYGVAHGISTFYASHMMDNVMAMVDKMIKNNPSDPGAKQEFIVKTVRNWMAVTSGAYNQVASAPASEARDFNRMIEEMLKTPARNGGLTQKELYGAIVKAALDTFGPKITWDQTIDSYFQSEIKQDSPFHVLNPLLKGFNFVCSWGLKLFTFLPQWIGNQIIQKGAKFAVGRTQMLQQIAESKMEELRRNTPTSYAVQKLIFRQLQKVLTVLQEHLRNNAAGEQDPLVRNTHIRRLEISNLVEYLFEVLNKSQYRTQDRLNRYLQQRGPVRDRLTHELEESCLPEILESAVGTISITLKAVTDEKELRQSIYDGLCLANDAFDVQAPIPDAEFANAERANLEMIDQIIETAAFHAIEEKFDFTNERQQRDLTQFITTFKEQTRTFNEMLTNTIRQIADPQLDSPLHIQSKITEMLDASIQFNRKQLELLSKADGNHNLHTSTKNELNILSRDLIARCTPLANRLNALKNTIDESVQVEKRIPSLIFTQEALCALRNSIAERRISPAQISFCKIEIDLIKTHLATLRQEQLPDIAPLEQTTTEIEKLIEKIEFEQKEERKLPLLYPLFIQLKAEKLRCLGASPSEELERRELALLADILNLGPPDQRELLRTHLCNFMNAQNAGEIERTSREWTAAYTALNAQNLSALTGAFAQIRMKCPDLIHRVQQISQEHLHTRSEKREEIRLGLGELNVQSPEMNNWADAQTGPHLWNILPFDMQWLSESVKNIAFNRAQAKLRLFFDSLYQKHNFIGFVNQGVILPALEAFGPNYLKNRS